MKKYYFLFIIDLVNFSVQNLLHQRMNKSSDITFQRLGLLICKRKHTIWMNKWITLRPSVSSFLVPGLCCYGQYTGWHCFPCSQQNYITLHLYFYCLTSEHLGTKICFHLHLPSMWVPWKVDTLFSPLCLFFLPLLCFCICFSGFYISPYCFTVCPLCSLWSVLVLPPFFFRFFYFLHISAYLYSCSLCIFPLHVCVDRWEFRIPQTNGKTIGISE